jgi:phage tail-like protein
VCFAVQVAGQDMGAFTSCEGLGFEVTVLPYEEGGNHGFVHQLPGRIKYTNVKLTRAVTKDTAKIAEWVAKMAFTPERTTASITAMTSTFQPVVRWGLLGVIPVRWTGPQLSVDSPKVATETLELAHHGFDPSTTGPAPGAR